MPLYDYKNSITGQTEEHQVKIADRWDFLKQNPHLTPCVSAPMIGDPILHGITKPPGKLNDVFQKVKAAHPYGTIQTR